MIHHTYLVYRYAPKTDRIERHLVAKYAIVDGDFLILADYADVFHGMTDGPLTADAERKLARITKSSYCQVVQKPTYSPGDAPPDEESDPTPAVGEDATNSTTRRPAVFDFHREGMDQPHRVEVRGSAVVLDGNALEPEEAQRLLADVRSGLGSLRYVPSMQTELQKIEYTYFDMHKAEGVGFNDAWQVMRGLVESGHLPKEHFDSIRKELYQDEMTPLGNKRAFHEHLAGGPRPGVYMLGDLNGLKAMNDAAGHDAGDSAIKSTGHAIRNAINATVGSGNAKAWRIGGDEFGIHAASYEHAGQILRHLRGELEKVPAIAGTHKLSMSVGLGPDHLVADQALYHAKNQKQAKIVELGGNPHDRAGKIQAPDALYVHSLHPGFEGPVPVQSQANIPPPKTPPVLSEPVINA